MKEWVIVSYPPGYLGRELFAKRFWEEIAEGVRHFLIDMTFEAENHEEAKVIFEAHKEELKRTRGEWCQSCQMYYKHLHYHR